MEMEPSVEPAGSLDIAGKFGAPKGKSALRARAYGETLQKTLMKYFVDVNVF
jgi:hypothetical protein